MRRTVSSGSGACRISVITAFSPRYANPQPTAEPLTASATFHEELSDQAARVAPSVTRMAISAFAGGRRASNRLATLLQAISSSRKTAEAMHTAFS